MCVIADDEGVESLAGIMGGEKTGCDETTTDVLIESALWVPHNIAQTGRKLGINSDARYRFERGVDPAFMLPGLELATRMVLDLCGGTPSEITVAGNAEPPEKIIDFPLSELERLAGLDVPLADMRRVLDHLGFFVAGQGERVKVAVPSWRPDIEGKADIVEEVDAHPRRRQRAADAVPARRQSRKPVLTPIQLRTRKAKRALAARGLVEAVTWSFISKPQAELFGGGKPELALANPIAAELSDMRPSLMPGLIAAAQRNADRGFPDVGPVRSRPDFPRRPARGSVHRRVRHSPRAGEAVRLSAAIGPSASSTTRSTPSTPRPMRSARWSRPARRRRRCRSCPAGRPGCIPAAPAPSRSGRRTCSAISANCIRARWRRSMPRARSSASR